MKTYWPDVFLLYNRAPQRMILMFLQNSLYVSAPVRVQKLERFGIVSSFYFRLRSEYFLPLFYFILIPSCIWMKGKQRRSDPEDSQNRSGSVLRPAGSPPLPPSIHAASIDLLLIVVNASAFAVLWNWILIVLLYRQGLGIVRRSIYYCWLKSIIFFYVSALNKIALF